LYKKKKKRLKSMGVWMEREERYTPSLGNKQLAVFALRILYISKVLPLIQHEEQ
jgi:hypothetical protein